MKPFNRLIKELVLLILIVAMAGCEQKTTIESVVAEDGSIDRKIVFPSADSTNINRNIFSASQRNGWTVIVEPAQQGPDEKKGKEAQKKNKISFSKHFASASDANLVMNVNTDTLFRIKSDFQKQFRWFYTYINYSDTYISLNRFHDLSQELYFTPEDYTFIERLPAEGAHISKADSLYLSRLNEKIYDHYASRAIYEEYFKILSATLLKNNADLKLMDTLKRRKEEIYQQLSKSNGDSISDDFLSTVNRVLRVPLPFSKKDVNFRAMSAELENRINFMTSANEGKYTHIIKMPWDLVKTNADSIHGSEFYWRPPVTKFLLKDYTMNAETRKLNYWTVIITLLVIVATVVTFRRRTTS